MSVEGLHDRLRGAVRRWHGDNPGEGQRAFAKAMQHRSRQREQDGGQTIPGVSRPMIQRYLSGDTLPPVAFLEGAAEVLGVRSEWLAFGKGQMTEAEEAAAGNADVESIEVAMRKIREVCPLVEAGSPGVQALVKNVWLRYAIEAVKRKDGSTRAAWPFHSEEIETMAFDLAVMLEPPETIVELGVPLESGWVDAYLVAMCQALAAMLPHHAITRDLTLRVNHTGTNGGSDATEG